MMSFSLVSAYSWGSNSHGQLLLGNCEDAGSPEEVTFDVPWNSVSDVVFGGGHVLILLKNGELLSTGWNNKGQCCGSMIGQYTVLSPLDSLLFDGKCVKQVAAGWDFTIFLLDDGVVFAAGSNAHCQCGVDCNMMTVVNPVHVNVHSVICVAAGLRHAVAVCNDGAVFVWGSGKHGQLAAPIKSSLPRSVSGLVVQNGRCLAGSYHSLVVDTINNSVFIWGDNRFGQCGLQPSSHQTVFIPRKMVELNVFGKILNIHTGWSHLITLHEKNVVCSWGRNDFGQLGRTTVTPHIPDIIECPSDIKVKQVASGAEHCLMLSDDGCIFTWGWNEHGICAFPESDGNVLHPKLVKRLQRCFAIYAGGGCSLVLNFQVT